jgi:hypothetical protein
MYFVLMDSTGNLIASYRDEDEARAALEQLVEDDPDAADEVALLTYDEDGAIAADPVFVAPTAAVGALAVESQAWYGGTPTIGELHQATQTGQLAEPIAG